MPSPEELEAAHEAALWQEEMRNTTPADPAHILPPGDVFDHEADQTCPCGPTVHRVDWPEFSWWAMAHKALDPAAVHRTFYDQREGVPGE